MGRSDSVLSARATCRKKFLSKPGDTCESIEADLHIVPGTVKFANSFLTCNDIFNATEICIPDGPTDTENTQPGCMKQTYLSQDGDTW